MKSVGCGEALRRFRAVGSEPAAVRGNSYVVFAQLVGSATRRCYDCSMKSEKSLFGSPEAEARSEARAEADIRDGRVINHGAVRRWLQSWRSAKRLPRPRVGD